MNHCYDLRFSRPQKATIARRAKAVAKMEGMDVDDNAAEMLVETNGNDIRQVVHGESVFPDEVLSAHVSCPNHRELVIGIPGITPELSV